MIEPEARVLPDAVLNWVERADDRGLFITDGNLVIQSWNRWLALHTGRTSASAVGANLYTLYPDLVTRGFDKYYADALAGEPRLLSERFHRYLLPMQRAIAGHTHDMAQSVRIEPLRAKGAVVGTITVIHDVTDRIMAERELRSRIAAAERARAVAEHSAHLKDEFLLTLSHEIRTPLNTVVGWARVLRGRAAGRMEAAALESIERNGLRQIRIVDDLLAMSKLISGRLRLSLEPTDVARVVREAVAAIADAADAKRIALPVTIDAGLPTISADPLRLQQALWTLLSNAVKFTPVGGLVEIGVTNRDERVSITVRDDGIGIPAEFLPHVFDLFRQADGSPTRSAGGLGLGLALARRIVELHGGHLGVESEGHNRGSLFWIELPLTLARPAATTASPALPSTPGLTGIELLVVSPDVDARHLLVALLRDYGATVRSAASTRDATALLRANGATPDAVIADIEGDAEDAYIVLRQIREDPALDFRHVRGIAIGSPADGLERLRALAAGFEHHLTTPLDPALLAATIEAAVRR